uniref:Reverse transcriptase domain-containing protein n=1 Tax=Amphimedon queenslandica TaxID=400682 RepID=A0A1X7URG1_AMPQE
MPALLLQKPPGKVAVKELTKHLDRRLTLWYDGDIESLVREGRAIQSRLKHNQTYRLARRFSDLMFLDECSVKDILLDKHPPGQPAQLQALVLNSSPSATSPYDPILFDAITPDLIRSTALKTTGSSGPSGLDAICWRRLCLCYVPITGL